jgi:ABC-type multidrug transport system ATPase subunit
LRKDLEKQFPNGVIGLRDINISEGPGKLIGIMGASGAGKTTLLNVLSGIDKPTAGTIKINGIEMFSGDKEKVKGAIGYVSQDDLLIEELTVYQNLYYNAKLCFADLSEEELDERVMGTLSNLGLDQSKDLRVGTVLDKTISGGQRKRLNIALELIREPAVLFVDEPTSGLSSRDSENVIDLLKELSLKGKLIFVVIHQPSSDIYKMFDKMMIMDVGGYPIYYGPPVEAVTYFKAATNQVGADKGQCQTCGNVNPEQIFNIIEAKVVDEYGEFTSKRKVTQCNGSRFTMKNLIEEDSCRDKGIATFIIENPITILSNADFH